MLGARSLVPDLLTASSPFGLSLSKLGCVCSQAVRAELVEALACWFGKHACVQGGGRESPGMRVTFFRVAERKSPKKGRPPVCDPFASLRGDPRRGGCGVRRRTHFALARCVQTTAASQTTRHARFDAHAHPATAPTQAQPAGGGQPNSRTSTRAIASLGLATAAQSACAFWAERRAAEQWPEWMFSPNPLCVRRGAQRAGWHVCRRTHMLRGLARRSCLNGAAKQRSEFCGAPRPRAPQVAPARSAGDADSGVAFSLVTFFWRRKRKLLACRATPGLRLQHGHAFPTSTSRLRQAQPERSGKTIKNIATSAC